MNSLDVNDHRGHKLLGSSTTGMNAYSFSQLQHRFDENKEELRPFREKSYDDPLEMSGQGQAKDWKTRNAAPLAPTFHARTAVDVKKEDPLVSSLIKSQIENDNGMKRRRDWSHNDQENRHQNCQEQLINKPATNAAVIINPPTVTSIEVIDDLYSGRRNKPCGDYKPKATS